jgi:hypothetical protein
MSDVNGLMTSITQTDNTLELISKITELNDLSEYMSDKELDTALHLVLKLVMSPNVPSSKAPALIVQLQALAAKFAILATTYATILKDKAGTVNNNKKNVYYTMSSALDRVVDALKYSAKYGMGH